MPAHQVTVSPTARTRAERAGDAGRRWLDELPEQIAALERRWSMTIGEAIPGANEGFVAHALLADGTETVLKLLAPAPWRNDQLGTLDRANGRGYVRALESDEESGAVLLEALGEPLGRTGWTPGRIIDTLVGTLRTAWRVPPSETPGFMTGEAKARGLAELVETSWDRLGRPCSAAVVETALRFAERRRVAHDAAEAVWAHGDPHAENALRVPHGRPGAESGFVFVDPEGLWSEPAYDLGVILRDWDAELAAADDPAALARRLCAHLAAAAGADSAAVWEWGFLERVSTGLFVLDLGVPWGRDKLANAERLTTDW